MISISRRHLIGGGASLLAGGITAAIGYRVLRDDRSSLSVLGRKESQCWFLNLGSMRALLLLGAYDPTLMDGLPSLIHIDSHRVDILIASNSLLQQVEPSILESYRVSHVVSAQADATLAAPAPNTTSVVSSQHIDFGEAELRVHVEPEIDAFGDQVRPEDPAWYAELVVEGQSIILASRWSNSLQKHGPNVALVGVPELPDNVAPEMTDPAIVTNARPSGHDWKTVIVPGTDEPLTFVFGDDGILLPESYSP